MAVEISSFNPYAMEGHYSLDMACYLLHRDQPSRVHIATSDGEVAKAAVRRLDWVVQGLTVETTEIAEKLTQYFGRCFEIGGEHTDATLVLFPDNLHGKLPRSKQIVVCIQNKFSYKSLISKKPLPLNSLTVRAWMRRAYTTHTQVGLFGPTFLAHWAIAQAAGSRWPPMHFAQGQKAMDRIYSRGFLWWLGYIVIIAGRRRESTAN